MVEPFPIFANYVLIDSNYFLFVQFELFPNIEIRTISVFPLYQLYGSFHHETCTNIDIVPFLILIINSSV